jgi:hypothetical protein
MHSLGPFSLTDTNWMLPLFLGCGGLPLGDLFLFGNFCPVPGVVDYEASVLGRFDFQRGVYP